MLPGKIFCWWGPQHSRPDQNHSRHGQKDQHLKWMKNPVVQQGMKYKKKEKAIFYGIFQNKFATTCIRCSDYGTWTLKEEHNLELNHIYTADDSKILRTENFWRDCWASFCSLSVLPKNCDDEIAFALENFFLASSDSSICKILHSMSKRILKEPDITKQNCLNHDY